MGLDIHIHIGAYAVIKAPLIKRRHIFKSCSIHGEGKGKYCDQCGGKLRTVETVTEHAASLYSLLPEDKYCDDLTWAAGEDNLDVILAIGNRNNDGASVGDIDAEGGATINEITPDMPQRFIAAFNAEYADVLAVLRERATSVDVKFGVLTWWS